MNATAELNLFSGFPNPTWPIEDADGILQDVLSLPMEVVGFKPTQSYGEPLGRPRSGYRGIDLTFASPSGTSSEFAVFGDLVLDLQLKRVRRDAQRVLEKTLISQVPKPMVAEMLNGMTFDDLMNVGHEASIKGLGTVPTGLKCESAPSYLGDAGDFHQHQFRNNCYNYATTVLNTVPTKQAIPGTPNLHQSFDMQDLRDKLKEDGLDLLGSSLPNKCPEPGSHYMAVLLRHHPTGKVKDFHCMRLDRNGVWSHKDGKGEVINVDGNGDLLDDLNNAALSWSPELAGFYQFFDSRKGKIK